MNRKGGDRIISIYWFTILFIVAAAIVYMVAVFYGKPYDVREIEADILMDRVSDCVSKAGYLLDSALEENFLENCGLNFDVEDIYGWGEEGQYFVEVNIKDFLSLRQITPSSKKGNEALKEFCNLEGDILPFCLERTFYTIDKTGKQFRVDVLSIVRKTEKNAQ
ncbi:MAG TPA: hypothetical protein ENI22_00320 [Candidatus Pacearchaeota archaeon]|nr:hypothetical protein [Candidatus Pacearchaeota archaeon]